MCLHRYLELNSAGFDQDPSILRVRSDYSIATPTPEWVPDVQIHHSKDLVHWKLTARPLNRLSRLIWPATRTPAASGCHSVVAVRYAAGHPEIGRQLFVDGPGSGVYGAGGSDVSDAQGGLVQAGRKVNRRTGTDLEKLNRRAKGGWK